MFSFSISLLNKVLTLTWYLKPFISFKRSLNKSLMLYLIASNGIIGSLKSIISTL